MAGQKTPSRVSTPGGVIRALGAGGAAALGAAAGTYNKVYSALSKQFPNLDRPSLIAAAQNVYGRGKNLAQVQASPTAQSFPRGFVQNTPTLINPVRYIVQFSYTNPTTGQQVTGHIPIDRQSPLTPNQVIQAAADLFPYYHEKNPSDLPPLDEDEEVTPRFTVIRALQRD